MQADMLKEYRNRWQAVAAIEEVEQEKASLILRWRQLNSIVQIAMALGLSAQSKNEEVAVIRDRWNKLRTFYVNTL